MKTELNLRFAPGAALADMVALHKEFGIFSPGHTLRNIAVLLDLVPEGAKNRRRWFWFLGNLLQIGSDIAGMNGHERVISAIKENLESKNPKPIFFKLHHKNDHPCLRVTVGTASVFGNVECLIISAPVAFAPIAPARVSAEGLTLVDQLRGRTAKYYSSKLKRHGTTSLGVDWDSRITQKLRFVQLLKVVDFDQARSLNDFGCGYGALLAHLEESYPGTAIAYRGIDVSQTMIEAALGLWSLNPSATFAVGATCDRLADYSVASGVFNVRQGCPIDHWEDYVTSILIDLRSNSRLGFSVNFMLPGQGAPFDWALYGSRPEPWIEFGAAELGCSMELISDYGLGEFTLLARILPGYHKRSML